MSLAVTCSPAVSAIPRQRRQEAGNARVFARNRRQCDQSVAAHPCPAATPVCCPDGADDRAHVGKDNRQIGDAEAADLDLIDTVPAAHDSVARDASDLYGAQLPDLPLVLQCAEKSEVADTPVRSGIKYAVETL